MRQVPLVTITVVTGRRRTVVTVHAVGIAFLLLAPVPLVLWCTRLSGAEATRLVEAFAKLIGP